jgi:hypothetical protein
MTGKSRIALFDLLVEYVFNSYAEMEYILKSLGTYLSHDPRVSRLNDHIQTAKRLMVINHFVNHIFS